MQGPTAGRCCRIEGTEKVPHWSHLKTDGYHIVCGVAADLTIDVADESGENPEDQHVVRQLKAGERVLTKVRREKNNL